MNLNQVVIDEYPNSVVENAKIAPEYLDIANKMAESAIAEFLTNICKIARPSGDCKEISKYLYSWAKEHNLEPTMDESLNVYWDVPASPNCEDWPKVIFQTHMDMVWETNTEKKLPPSAVDAVYNKEDGTIHTRDYKTTLGADAGEGIITLLELSKDYGLNHGPLRIIFTRDEETTMAGALGLDKEVLDSDYVLNIDGRQMGIIRTFSCGVYSPSFTKHYSLEQSKFDNELTIEVSGLKGGHSGNAIIYDRVNAIDVLRRIINEAINREIDFSLISLEGGQSKNTIPVLATMKLSCIEDDVAVLKEISNAVLRELMEISHDDKEGKCNFQVEKANSKVFSTKDLLEIMELLNELRYKVYDIHEEAPGVAKNSLNLAIIKIKDGDIAVHYKARYGEARFMDYIADVHNKLSEKLQMDVSISESFPAWYPAEDKKLLNTYMKASKDVCGIDMIVSGTHGGLEVGVFSQKKPSLVCISIGADVEDEHNFRETFYTKSLAPHFATLINMLENFH